MKTWLVLTPIVFAVYVASVFVYASVYGKPAEHPLLAPFQTAAPPIVVALLAAEAIVAAPIREELMFRGILLPWMAARGRAGDGGILFAALAVPLVRFLNGATMADVASSGLASTALAAALWITSRLIGERWAPAESQPESDPGRPRAAVRAVFGSAAIFAICHWGVPPTPLPLAFLAVGLGWLALRTRGVLAPILVHALFNAVAFIELVVR
jgi:membrane protease YdiL (CAAX protease family)